MIESTLHWLEVLAKYGFIDIILAAGLFTALRRLFRSRTVNSIDGLEVLTSINDHNLLRFEVRNQTRDTVYVYRAYFKSGYFGAPVTWGWVRASIYHIWIEDQSPKVSQSEPRNADAQYLLDPLNVEGDPLRPPFLEQRASLQYRLQLDSGSLKTEPFKLVHRRIGQITLHLIYGKENRVLQVDI